MFIDDVTIKVQAGNGGKGAVAFNKNLMSLGPTGGTGGNGGSIFLEGVSDLGALRQFRFKKELIAKNGEDGRGQYRDGRTSEDLIVKVPIGTVIHNAITGTKTEITAVGTRVRIVKGGHGGRGNFHFRSATNTSPKEFELGTKGEEYALRLELQLIADVGLIGFPNAGKSSLLNELTNAKSKIGNYEFTTLEPNLGTYYDMVIADLPGLIEGAAKGKGLGIKFLRHIKRTKVLFHLIASEVEEPIKAYKIIRKELQSYDEALLEKKEFLFLSKSDTQSAVEIQKKLKALRKLNPDVLPVSIHDEDSLMCVKKILNKLIEEKRGI